MLRPRRVSRNIRQVQLRLHRRRKLNLGLLRRLAQPLQRLSVVPQVNPFSHLELVSRPINNLEIEVIPTQEGIAIGGLHLKNTIAHFQNRNVKRTAAQVVDGNHLILGAAQPIGQRRSRWLIDNPHHFQTSNFARVLSRLPLAVIKIGGDGNHRLRHGIAQIGFGIHFDLLQHHRRNFRRRIFTLIHHHANVTIGCLLHVI